MIQDSSDIDLSRHSKRLTGKQLIGPIGNHQGLGFIMHSAFVLDARLLTPIGFSSVQMFHRTTNEQTSKQKHAANHHKPIELKESYKWIKACEEAKKYLSKANHITIIEDREGDIFEQFARIPDKRTDLIVRSKSNRQIIDGGKLFEILSNESVAGIYEIGIDADARKKKGKKNS